MVIAEAVSIVGIAGALAGWAGCMIAIYRQSDGWALGTLVFDVVLLLAVFRYRGQTRRHALILLAGIVLAVAGQALALLLAGSA